MSIEIIRQESNLPLFWDKQIGDNALYAYDKNKKLHTIKICNKLPNIPSGIIGQANNSEKYIEQEMHSFTRNYYNRIISQVFGVASNVLGTTFIVTGKQIGRAHF